MSRRFTGDIQHEADVLCRYITGRKATDSVKQLYMDSFKYLHAEFSAREQKLWLQMIRNPGLIPYIDSGLSLSGHGKLLRKRILLMFAITESRPEYSDCFIGPEPGVKAFIKFIGDGFAAIYYALSGLILLKLI